MGKLYRIGFDIGIGSVGWAVLENDVATEDPNRILKLGVRTFSPNETSDGKSTAESRREKRGIHRRTRRRFFRLERIKNLLKNNLGLQNLDDDLAALAGEDVYKLRTDALDKKLSNAELAKVVLNIAKRRGFRSNRKSLDSGSEEGKLKTAIAENKKLLEEKGYRTIGEALYKDERFKTENCGELVYIIRNHSGDYRNCFHRDDLKYELELILKTQKELGNNLLTDELISQIVYIFDKQRNFDEGPGKPSPYSAEFEVGNCTFIENEKRAPKASFTFEYFSALSKINSLKIGDETLTIEQKQQLIEIIKTQKELKFDKIRKLFAIPEEKLFNLCRYSYKKKDKEIPEDKVVAEAEKATFVSMKNSYEIKNALGLIFATDNISMVDEAALCLSVCKSDARIEEFLKNSQISFSNEQIENLKKLNFEKFGSLSIKAMNKIIPYLEKGDRYDIACKNAGFNHSSFNNEKLKYLKGEKVEERLDDITSNVVKRAVNQTLRILNEIIKEYGSPQYVTVELARELSNNFEDRNKIKKLQEKNLAENEKAKAELAEEFNIIRPTHFDVMKKRLYKEQDGKCMYSGKAIDINRLYELNYVQVDHIIPYSRSMNDSYTNKVLVLTDENQNKLNQTPFEYFGSDEKRWNEFVTRVNLLKNREKRRLLLKEKFGEEESNEFIERNLNDTKYMAKFMLNLMQDLLQMTPSKIHKKQVRSVNGAVTSYLRRFWGINKIREDGDVHHAIDAAIIATVTDGQVQKITNFNKMKERFVFKDGVYINKTTGEVMTKEQKEEYQKQGLDVFSKLLPPPYREFIPELALRSRTNYVTLSFTNEEKLELAKLGYAPEEIDAAKPIFVSRMKNVKLTGAIHKETIMSTREYAETKNLIKTVSLSELKLKNNPETIPLKDDKYPEYSIENYYKPESDRLLYLKLKEHLKENGSIPKNEVFYKPKKDGSDGPVVKTVKVYEKAGVCVITPNGGAKNDRMHRVDVYEKDKKFYLCPVYYADVYAKNLPNKLIVQGKDWIERDDSFDFKFSLYQNDLIKVTNNKEIVLSKNFKNDKSNKKDSIQNKEFLMYYNKTGITTASITASVHDNCYKIDSLGVKTLLNIEKYYVDIIGNIYKAPKEERKGF